MNYKCPLEPKPSWCCEQCKKIDENDPQKIRLYCFEETLTAFINDYKPLSLAECKQIIESICHIYKVPTPEIKDGRGLKVARAGYNPDKILRIKLPRQYRYRVAVLHEATHCILQYRIKLKFDREPVYQHHGALYTKYLFDIYSSQLNIPLSYLKTVAKQFSLDF